jgi:hypothetical protein
MSRYCDYGCGQKAIHQFKSGKWCCSKYHAQCPSVRKKNSQNNIGWKPSKESRLKNSISNKGLKRSNTAKLSMRLSINEIKKKYPIFSKIEEMRYNNKLDIQVHCKNHKCKNSKEQGGWFTPNKGLFFDRIYSIERSIGYGESNFYCCNKCKIECPLFNKRSDNKKPNIKNYTDQEYNIWRSEVLKRANYLCEYCEVKATHAHHSRPQKLEPGFVLDPDFGISCCEKCHYKYGHKDECSTGQLANKECI